MMSFPFALRHVARWAENCDHARGRERADRRRNDGRNFLGALLDNPAVGRLSAR